MSSAASSSGALPPSTDEPELSRMYPVHVGSTLGRAAPSPFVALRYADFKPASADMTQTGLLTVDGSARAQVDLPASDGVVSFAGHMQRCRDVECLLLFDREKGMFSLERLGAVASLRHDRRGGAKGIERLEAVAGQPIKSVMQQSIGEGDDNISFGSEKSDDDEDEEEAQLGTAVPRAHLNIRKPTQSPASYVSAGSVRASSVQYDMAGQPVVSQVDDGWGSDESFSSD